MRDTGSAPPVVVNCLNKEQVRPASFVLTCADGNDSLSGMHWTFWQSTAYGTGTQVINDCVPNCAEGTFYHFPVLVVLWRPQPLPGHQGTRYFSRMTGIFSAQHCLPAFGGGRYCMPVTSTSELWSHL